jgi:hypothetical protein
LSNLGRDAHKGREAARPDVELALLLAMKKITPHKFQDLAFAELDIDHMTFSRKGS